MASQVQKRWWTQGWFVLVAITVFAACWRFYFFSGDGLGDDPNFFAAYYEIFSSGHLRPIAYHYRIGFWIPILLIWKLFGVSELTWIMSITAASLASIVLIYFLGRCLFSERVGLIAAVLLAVHPFDVLTSTLFVIDIPFSFYVGVAMLLFLLAIKFKDWRSWLCFILSAFFIFWSYTIKMCVLFTFPIFALLSVINYRKWRYLLTFYASLIVLFGTSLVVDLWLTGDLFGYYHAEHEIAGLWKITLTTLLEYPRLMFLPNQYGRLFHGLYCWFAIPALIVAIRYWHKTYFVFIWLIGSFLTMEFMPHKIALDGWYSIWRIFRYLSVFIIPCSLILAFATEVIIRRWHKAGKAALLIFVSIALVQGYHLTFPSRDAFNDMRQAARKAVALPSKPIYSDFMMMSRIERFHFQYKKPHLVRFIRAENPIDREVEFSKISNAYVITGGARLPYYGCDHCIANLGNFRIPDNWKLVWVLDKQTAPWRRETLRIWEVGP